MIGSRSIARARPTSQRQAQGERAPEPSDPTGTERLLTPGFTWLLFVQMAFGFSFSTFFLLPKFLATELHAGATQIGLLSGMFGLAGIVAVPIVSWGLSARTPRALVILGCGVMAVSAFGFLAVDEVGVQAAFWRLAQGVASALVYNAGLLLVVEVAPSRRLAQAIGWFASANLMMNAVAPVAAELLAERAGFAPAFALAGAAALLAALLASRLRQGQRPARQASVWAVARTGHAVRMAFVLLSFGVGFGVMFFFSQPFALSVGIRDVRGFFVTFTLGALFVRVFLGRIADFVGYRRVSLLSLFCYAGSIAAMVWLAVGRLEWIGAAFGLAQGFFLPAFTALVLQHARAEERGPMMVLFNAYFGTGSAAVLLLGVVAETVGYRGVFVATSALVSLAPLALLRWPTASTPDASVTGG